MWFIEMLDPYSWEHPIPLYHLLASPKPARAYDDIFKEI